MVTTAFHIFVFTVLASTLIEEFGLSRLELGLIGSINPAVGALTAPTTGRLSDRFGPRRSAVVAQIVCAVGFCVMAAADNVWMLAVSAVITGPPQGVGNPITNALIAERVEPGRRGTVTGIKQSGVQLGIFLAGATLPFLADRIGWRGAVLVYAGAFVVSALLPLQLPDLPRPSGAGADVEGASTSTPVPRFIWVLAFYALVMGTAGGAISRFLALFSEEEVGLSNAEAGLVVALSGIAGMATRVWAGRVAEQRSNRLTMLAQLAIVGAVTSVLLMTATSVGAWVLWPIALLFALGHAAWNAVAMLAIIVGVTPGTEGRASGVVMVGFFSGLTIGPPLAGLLVDRTGSYQWLWIAATALAITGAASVWSAGRRLTRTAPAPAPADGSVAP